MCTYVCALSLRSLPSPPPHIFLLQRLYKRDMLGRAVLFAASPCEKET